MKYRLDIAPSQGGATIISLHMALPADTVFCYVFGDGALNAAQLSAAHSAIHYHVGSPYEYAAVMHLGCGFDPLLLGSADVFGSADAQSERLNRFFATAPALLGAYGSWWPESYAHLRGIAAAFSGAAIRIRLFLRSMQALPFEWDADAVGTWLAQRPARSDCRLVLAEAAAGGGALDFDEWRLEGSSMTIASPQRLIVSTRDLLPLPVPSLRLPGATRDAIGAASYEITLPLRGLPASRQIQIAHIEGVLPCQIRVVVR